MINHPLAATCLMEDYRPVGPVDNDELLTGRSYINESIGNDSSVNPY